MHTHTHTHMNIYIHIDIDSHTYTNRDNIYARANTNYSLLTPQHRLPAHGNTYICSRQNGGLLCLGLLDRAFFLVR